MKTLLSILLIISSNILFAVELPSAEMPDYALISKAKNKDLKKGTCEIIFTITGLKEKDFTNPIRWSVDQKEYTTKLKELLELRTFAKAGEHDFKFWYSKKYREIITRKIKFEAGYTYTYRLNFKETDREMLVRKPVIYVYPEKETNVKLNVIPKGEMVFTYPIISEKGWEFKAHPDGTLEFEQDRFRYLFWESSQQIPIKVSHRSGSYVDRKDVLSFLERTLTSIGLTSEEKADMITYWGPLMQRHEMVLVQFYFNEACDQFATLEISPKPQNVNRIYIVFEAVDSPSKDIMLYPPLVYPKFIRSGFTVVEWGGIEIEKREL